MLAVAQQRLGQLKSAGASVHEAMRKDPLADLNADWGGVMFDSKKWTMIIWNGL